MDEQEKRKQFIMNLDKFCNQIELNDAFMIGLTKHSKREYIDVLMRFPDQMTRKVFIFTEFTRERSACIEMIQILFECGQINAAIELMYYNTSPDFMSETNEISLNVTPALSSMKGNLVYRMEKIPRGMCVIINNVEDLRKESLRFKDVFKKLYFNVELQYDLTAVQMEKRLNDLSQEQRLLNDDALIVMIISHGRDERAIGVDEEELRISEIVDIFSDINCPALAGKPKLFFFNCCRVKIPEVPVRAFQSERGKKIIIELETVGQNWISDSNDTLIVYACAEGYESWYIQNEFTYFGQKLSHCIAQYSCDKDLLEIIALTCTRMRDLDSPEIRLLKIRKRLFFNPGLP